uniref:Uncharacterized protein n=1 Tax=Solanum tuberosum TaxID=4113 RepID=M1BBW0_SOLTU
MRYFQRSRLKKLSNKIKLSSSVYTNGDKTLGKIYNEILFKFELVHSEAGFFYL